MHIFVALTGHEDFTRPDGLRPRKSAEPDRVIRPGGVRRPLFRGQAGLRDLLNEPLGADPQPPAKSGRGLRGLATAVVAVATLAAAGGLAFRWQTMGASPGAVAEARIDTTAPSAPTSAAAVPAPTPGAANPGLAPTATAQDVETSSGVKIVRNGGGSSSGAMIINVRQALSVHLSPAPDLRLAEKSRFGTLPRVGADGAKAQDVYARPVTSSARLANAPRIALLLGGVGLDVESTQAALSRMPPSITFGLAPYGADLEKTAADARDAGHELLLQAPMEGLGAANPGPHTLTASAPEAENRDSLRWLLSRFPGYFGVVNYLGAKFTGDQRAFAPVLAELAQRGLAYLDDGSSPRSLTRELAPTVNLRAGVADLVIDASPTPEAIDQALAKLEQLAQAQDGAIGVATALPVSVDRIARWAAGLEARGIALVPVSSILARPPQRSARATP